MRRISPAICNEWTTKLGGKRAKQFTARELAATQGRSSGANERPSGLRAHGGGKVHPGPDEARCCTGDLLGGAALGQRRGQAAFAAIVGALDGAGADQRPQCKVQLLFPLQVTPGASGHGPQSDFARAEPGTFLPRRASGQ